VGKIAQKAVCRSVFLTTWHCILNAELRKNALLQTVWSGDFGDFALWVVTSVFLGNIRICYGLQDFSC